MDSLDDKIFLEEKIYLRETRWVFEFLRRWNILDLNSCRENIFLDSRNIFERDLETHMNSSSDKIFLEEKIYLREMSFSISPPSLKYSQIEFLSRKYIWERFRNSHFYMDSLDDKIYFLSRKYIWERLGNSHFYMDSLDDKIYFLSRKYIWERLGNSHGFFS